MANFKNDLEDFFSKRAGEIASKHYPHDKFKQLEEKLREKMTFEEYLEFEDFFVEIIGDMQDLYFKKGFVDGMTFSEEVQDIRKDFAKAGQLKNEVQ